MTQQQQHWTKVSKLGVGRLITLHNSSITLVKKPNDTDFHWGQKVNLDLLYLTLYISFICKSNRFYFKKLYSSEDELLLNCEEPLRNFQPACLSFP